ncbi:MAG: terpene cyclase/mutase family protein [Planctomycetes bacterium]|nr:terpene cyclase/mutase family protein [Planctomycetota bacterium]
MAKQDEQDQEPVDDQQQVPAEGAEENLEEQQLAEESADLQEEERRGRLIGWGISASVHALAIIGLTFIVTATKQVEKETPPVRVATIDPPPVVEEKKQLERALETNVEVNVEAEQVNDAKNVTNLDVPVETVQRETDVESPVPKGREEAVGDSEMGGSGAFMAIGAGGGGSGMFGSRSGGGKKRAIGRGGGSKGSESAVEAALRWFKRHQSPDGSWNAQDYWKNCSEGAKCEPGKNHSAGDTTAAMTGYAVLCFLGAGFDHKTPSRYRDTVKKGVAYLMASQQADGGLGKGVRNYDHAVATMALAEAYAMAPENDLRGKAQKAVDLMLARQNQEKGDAKKEGGSSSSGKLGWDYVGPNQRNDGSVTGWNVMALKSALAAGLNIGGGMDGAKVYLEKAWKATNDKVDGKYKAWKDITPYDESRFPYNWKTGEETITDGHKNLACVGLVCGVFLGKTAGDPMIESLANYVMNNQVPKGYPTNTYYMYYNTLAIFQVGGDKWNKWNNSVRDMLVAAQKKTQDCFDGSWDWENTGFHGHETGRVLSTAYNCLCLEVYYRYAQVHKDKK